MADPASSIFVDQSETPVATIGSNYLQNFLTNGGPIEKGYGVLTQKRFYYQGKNLGGAGRTATSTTEEGVVSIEDITFTLFTHTRMIGALIFGIFLTVLGLALALVTPYMLALVVLALPFYIKYFTHRQSLFLIAFPGGSFSYDISWYPISEFRDFQRQLHLLKDHIKGV